MYLEVKMIDFEFENTLIVMPLEKLTGY